MALAERLWLDVSEPVVLGRGMNVLVHLRPAPVVARVTRLAHLVSAIDAFAGGVGLAAALGERAISPAGLIEPGPHAAGGRYITFWTYRPGDPAPPSEAGAALRAFHDAARSYRGPLRSFDPRPRPCGSPTWWGASRATSCAMPLRA